MDIKALLQVLNDYSYKFYFVDRKKYITNQLQLIKTIESITNKKVVFNIQKGYFELVD